MTGINTKILKLSFYLTYLVFPLTVLSILSVILSIFFPNKLVIGISVIAIVIELNSALISGLAVCYYKIEEFIQRSSLFEKLLRVLKINSNRRILLYITVAMVIDSMLLMYMYIVAFGVTPITVLSVVTFEALILIHSMLLGWCSDDFGN